MKSVAKIGQQVKKQALGLNININKEIRTIPLPQIILLHANQTNKSTIRL